MAIIAITEAENVITKAATTERETATSKAETSGGAKEREIGFEGGREPGNKEKASVMTEATEAIELDTTEEHVTTLIIYKLGVVGGWDLGGYVELFIENAMRRAHRRPCIWGLSIHGFICKLSRVNLRMECQCRR